MSSSMLEFSSTNPSLFQGYGIEAEYMIVDQDSFDISPSSDLLLRSPNNEIVNEIEQGDIAWSNELAKHVIEIKSNGPILNPEKIGNAFHDSLQNMISILARQNLTILPTAMHPWMNPDLEFKLWEYGNKEIYSAYNKIFNCKGHGWSNLQSVHINLAFQGDSEFRSLHSAIRLILPLIPMIAASSPYFESTKGHCLDNRINFYKNNQRRIPEITGSIIPEIAINKSDYISKILNPMYRAIAPYDTDSILQEEWLNSRGAIARFDRNAIEIRVMDIQESPKADQEIIIRIIEWIKKLTQYPNQESIENYSIGKLVDLLESGIVDGSKTSIQDMEYLQFFGMKEKLTAVELFFSNDSNIHGIDPNFFNTIYTHGNLAERMIYIAGDHPDHEDLKALCKHLNRTLILNQYLI